MMISKNKVVTIDYTLTDETGAVLDSSQHHGPLSFIQGVGNIIPGLESALEGKKMGDQLKTTVFAKDAYGMRDEELVHVVSKGQLECEEEIKLGMQFETQTEEGSMYFNVVEIGPDSVTLDGNHPLAGMDLHFDVKVVNVRDASKEELDHGHVHGEGGHHH